jgi:hypothetical protein
MTIYTHSLALTLVWWLFSLGNDHAPCEPRALTQDEEADFIRRIALHHGQPALAEFRSETLETVAFVVGTRCLQLVTLSWDGAHAGGVVVYEPGPGMTHSVRFLAWFPGARGALTFPGARFLFRWVSATGTGTFTEEAALMRPLGDSWVKVLSVTAARRVDPGGYSGEEPPAGSPFRFTSTFSARGDTLLITRLDSVGVSGTSSFQTRSSISRIVLP